MDLLTSCTHHSELQVIAALSLISTLFQITIAHADSSPACSVSNSRFLVTDVNSGDSSSSFLQKSSSELTANSELNSVAPIRFLITTLHGPSRKHRFQQKIYVVCVFVAAGTCFRICCLETDCVTPLFIRLFHGNSSTRYSMKCS
jgi:hypothetical protein